MTYRRRRKSRLCANLHVLHRIVARNDKRKVCHAIAAATEGAP